MAGEGEQDDDQRQRDRDDADDDRLRLAVADVLRGDFLGRRRRRIAADARHAHARLGEVDGRLAGGKRAGHAANH